MRARGFDSLKAEINKKGIQFNKKERFEFQIALFYNKLGLS
jgi:hypothetical protein